MYKRLHAEYTRQYIGKDVCHNASILGEKKAKLYFKHKWNEVIIHGKVTAVPKTSKSSFEITYNGIRGKLKCDIHTVTMGISQQKLNELSSSTHSTVDVCPSPTSNTFIFCPIEHCGHRLDGTHTLEGQGGMCEHMVMAKEDVNILKLNENNSNNDRSTLPENTETNNSNTNIHIEPFQPTQNENNTNNIDTNEEQRFVNDMTCEEDTTFQEEHMSSSDEAVFEKETDDTNIEHVSRLNALQCDEENTVQNVNEIDPDTLSTLIGDITNQVSSIDASTTAGKKFLNNLQWKSMMCNASQHPTDLYLQEAGISATAACCMDSPLDILLMLMPLTLWESIANETNQYEHQYKFVATKYRKKKSPFKPVDAVDIIVVHGLLLSHMLMPCRRGIKHQWRETSSGALGTSNFGQYMSKNRFLAILQMLHFSDNNDPKSQKDRIWKIRPVVDTLNQTFKAAFRMGVGISFDEATLPNRSRMMPIRVYNKNKPHKWGAKLFMVCDVTTAFCHHFDVYTGKKIIPTYENVNPLDSQTGPLALLRNVLYLRTGTDKKRIVYCDRYYTSVGLFIHLLTLGFYAVGTIITNRIGYPHGLIQFTERRKDIERGSTKIVKCQQIPTMCASTWMDSKPVNFLSTGITNEMSVVRRRCGKSISIVPCPNVVVEYQKGMGGVDMNDQLRLARYSVQQSYHFRKWYKSVYLGLFDLACTNAYILWSTFHQNDRYKSQQMSHGEFLEKLANECVNATHETIYLRRSRSRQKRKGSEAASSKRRQSGTMGHVIQKTKRTKRDSQGSLRLVGRDCKVCKIEGKRRSTIYECATCNPNNPIPVCGKLACTEGNIENESCIFKLHEKYADMFKTPTGRRKRKMQNL